MNCWRRSTPPRSCRSSRCWPPTTSANHTCGRTRRTTGARGLVPAARDITPAARRLPAVGRIRAEEGLRRAVPFLHNHRIFRYRDLPYATQLVPLGAIFGWTEDRGETYASRQRLGQWFWCGRPRRDVRWRCGNPFRHRPGGLHRVDRRRRRPAAHGAGGAVPGRAAAHAAHAEQRRLQGAVRAPDESRGGRDFKTGQPIDVHAYLEHAIDIHHIFPRHWCANHDVAPSIADCIVNKTALDRHTNAAIGGAAPSTYLPRIEAVRRYRAARARRLPALPRRRSGGAARGRLPAVLHQRFESLLRHAERAMGKPVNGGRTATRVRSPSRTPPSKPGVRSLIKAGESRVVEFKSTARRNLHTGAPDEAVTWAVVKTIAAFMNTHGGNAAGRVSTMKAVRSASNPTTRSSRGRTATAGSSGLTAAVKNALGTVAATDLPVRFCAIDGRTDRPRRCSSGRGAGIRRTKGRASGGLFRPAQQRHRGDFGTGAARLSEEALAGVGPHHAAGSAHPEPRARHDSACARRWRSERGMVLVGAGERPVRASTGYNTLVGAGPVPVKGIRSPQRLREPARPFRGMCRRFPPESGRT